MLRQIAGRTSMGRDATGYVRDALTERDPLDSWAIFREPNARVRRISDSSALQISVDVRSPRATRLT